MNNEPYNTNPNLVTPTPVQPDVQPVSNTVAYSSDIITGQPAASNQPAPTVQPTVSAPSAYSSPTPPATTYAQTPPPATAAPASPSYGMPSEYSSNPFQASAKGLGLALTVNPTSSLFVGLFALILIFGGFIVGGVLAAFLPGATGKFIGIFVILLVVIIGVFRLLAAITQIYDKSMSGETITTIQALGRDTSKGFFRFICTCIVMGLATLLATILLVIPGIIVGSRISMAPFIVYAENLGAMAAIKRSWRLSKGHTWEMISAIFASSLVVGSSGGLLSVIGAQSGTANRYYELRQAEQSGSGTGKMHWLNVFLPIVSVLLIVAYFGFIGYSVHDLKNRTTSSTSTSANAYCYYPSTSASATTKCVSQTECQAISECASLYTSGSSDSTSTDYNSIDNSYTN